MSPPCDHPFSLSRRHSVALLAASVAPAVWAQGGVPWSSIEARARGQKVFLNAWGGSERTNAYLQWAAAELQANHAAGFFGAGRRYGSALGHGAVHLVC